MKERVKWAEEDTSWGSKQYKEERDELVWKVKELEQERGKIIGKEQVIDEKLWLVDIEKEMIKKDLS